MTEKIELSIKFAGKPKKKSLINQISELIKKKVFCYDDIKDLIYYCIPDKLVDIENELIDFQNETKYLQDLKK